MSEDNEQNADELLKEKLALPGIEDETVVEEGEKRTRRIPHIRMKAAGKVDRTLEGIASLFRGNNPGMTCRWVYHPEHKGELSNILSRRAEGYSMVGTDELGADAKGLLLSDDEVRVADVVLMKISIVEQKELRDELAAMALDQTRSVNEKFHEAVSETVAGGVDTEHHGQPRGKVTIQERTHEYDFDQRSSGEG